MIEWLGSSHYSFLEATPSPGDLMREAHRLGYLGLGLADRMGQHGLVQAHQEFLNLKSESKDFFLPQASDFILKIL